MSATGFKGIDCRQTGNQLVFRAFLQDSSGAKVTTGTTSLSLYELQSDGTLKSYDFNDNTFKTTALTTATASMTHRTGNNATVNTAVWTYSLSNLTGFTAGAVYFAAVNNSGASPTDQTREFQYGSAEGDLLVTTGSTGQAYLQSDTIKLGGTTQTARDIGASVLLSPGTGPGQLNLNAGNAPIDVTQILPTSPIANSVGEALFIADILGGRINTAQGGAAQSITLDVGASSSAGAYVGDAIYLYGGTGGGVRGTGQRRTITSYNTGTKVAGVDRVWDTNPDNTSKFITLPVPKADTYLWLGSPPSTLGAAGTIAANVPGDVGGKVLGGGSGTIAGVGARAQDAFGSDIATASVLSAVGTAVTNLNNLSALANLFGPQTLEIPASSSIAYPFRVVVKTTEGLLEDLSTTPTIIVTNAAGTDRSANLSAVSHPSTGVYSFTYTVSSAAAQEGLAFDVSGTAASDATARHAYGAASVVSVDTTSALSSIKTQTDKLTFDGSNNLKSTPQTDPAGVGTLLTRIPGTIQPQTGDSYARLGVPAGASVSVDVAAVKSDTASLVGSMTTILGKWSGITSLANWLKAMLRSSTADATALSEIAGTYNPTTMSQQGIAGTLGSPAGASIAADIGTAKGSADTAAANASTAATNAATAATNAANANTAATAAQSAANTAATNTGTILAGGDGVTFTKLAKLLVAFSGSPKSTYTDNNNGTATLTLFAQDGTTAVLDMTFDKTTGARSASTIH